MKTRKYFIVIVLCIFCSSLYARNKDGLFKENTVLAGTLKQHVGEKLIFAEADIMSQERFCEKHNYWSKSYLKNLRQYNSSQFPSTRKRKVIPNWFITDKIVIELPDNHPILNEPDNASIEITNLKEDGVIEITYNKVSKSGTDVVRGTFRKFVLADTPKPELTKLEKIEQQVNALKLSLDEIQKQPADKINIQKVLSVITEQLLSISKQLDEIKKESNFSSNR